MQISRARCYNICYMRANARSNLYRPAKHACMTRYSRALQKPTWGNVARQACVEEILLLRKRSVEIQQSLNLLEEEKLTRIRHEYNARRSVLRSFRWKEKEVDPVVLEGAVAFWRAKRGCRPAMLGRTLLNRLR